jgi:hypothetical protein
MTDPAMKRVVSEIVRSPEDKRVYRGLELNNGLKAVLISDPTTDKSSAGLDVNIGAVFTTSSLAFRQSPSHILTGLPLSLVFYRCLHPSILLP